MVAIGVTSMTGIHAETAAIVTAVNNTVIGLFYIGAAFLFFVSLMGLLKDKGLMVGVVAVTGDRVETAEEVAAAIRSVMTIVDPQRLYPCSNCGMAPIPYDVALGKIRSLAAGADLVRQTL